MNAMSTRRTLLALSLPALALRVLYLLEIRKVLFFDHPVLDALEYVKWGREVAAGHLLWPEVRIHGPLYPFFLGAVFAISPDNYLLVGLLQAVVGVGSAWIAARIAADLTEGLFAPIVAFCAIAFGWIFVYYDGQWMPTTIIVFLDLLGAWMTLRAWGPEGRTRHAVGAGFALAGSALAWGPGLALLLIAPFCIALSRPPMLARWKRAGACLLAGGALLAPVMGWNHHLAGKWGLTQGNAWLNVYVGNNPNADGLPSVRPGIAWEELTQRELKDPETYKMGTYFYWTEHSVDALRLTGKKILLVGSNEEGDPSQDIAYFRTASHALSLPWPSTGVLIPLGVVGLVAGLRDARGRRIAALGLAASAVPIAFSVCARYRLPFEALSLPLAAALLARLVRGPCGAAHTAACGAVLALGVVAFLDPAHAGDARLFRTHDYAARELLAMDRLPEALSEVEKELRSGGRDLESMYDAAVIHLAAGHREQANRLLYKLEIPNEFGEPDEDAWLFLQRGWRQIRAGGEWFLERKRPEDALTAMRYPSAWIPDYHPVIRSLIGEALRRLGRLDEAITQLSCATGVNPPIPDAWVSLGAVYGQQKEYAKAAGTLEHAVELAPGNAQAWYNLAVADHFLGRGDAALRAAERARDLGHPDGEKLLGVLRK